MRPGARWFGSARSRNWTYQTTLSALALRRNVSWRACRNGGATCELFQGRRQRLLIPELALRVLPDMAAVVPNGARSLSFRTFAPRTCLSCLQRWQSSCYRTRHLGAGCLVHSGEQRGGVGRAWPRLAFHGNSGAISASTDCMPRVRAWASSRQIMVAAALGIGQVGLYNYAKALHALNDIGGALPSVAHPIRTIWCVSRCCLSA